MVFDRKMFAYFRITCMSQKLCLNQLTPHFFKMTLSRAWLCSTEWASLPRASGSWFSMEDIWFVILFMLRDRFESRWEMTFFKYTCSLDLNSFPCLRVAAISWIPVVDMTKNLYLCLMQCSNEGSWSKNWLDKVSPYAFNKRRPWMLMKINYGHFVIN